VIADRRRYTARVPACPNCAEDNPERARFCLACGAALAERPAQRREARKTVTVVFTDVAGFTSTAERSDPEALRRVMNRYFERMSAVVERHGGVVEKFIGDAVMAVFGIPTLHEDDALRGVRAAWDMREALQALNDEIEGSWGTRLAIRTGVNTGEVVAGDPASGQALVTGDAVNVAARLEQNAPAGGILIGEHTYRMVRDAVAAEGVEPVTAKGKNEPLRAFLLTDVTPGAPGIARRADAPMIGREHEQSLLTQAFERAVRERSCHMFTLLGSAGVGKSRLVEEVIAALRDQATVLSGRCLPYGEGITFWPIAEAITEAAGITDDDPLARAREKIAMLVRGEEHADRITQRVAEIVGLGEASGSPEEIFWAARKLMEALARQRPLIILFDDIHWGEPTFLDLVEHVADWTRDAPILLLCVARQELLDKRSGWGGGKLNATSILLEPLTEKESDELVRHLLGQTDIEPAVRDRITQGAEGNPLFVEEMLSMLIDDGLLRSEHGRWVQAGDVSAVSVPPTIHALLAARIDRLTEDERGVLERAAIGGKVFSRGAVLDLSDEEDRPRVDVHLMTLVRKELIRQDRSTFAGDEAFRFRHLLIRDAAYSAMSKELRAELHERFARWLEREIGERLVEYEEIIGYHLEQAFLHRIQLGAADDRALSLATEAGLFLAATGERARGRNDHPAAAKLIGRAIRLLRDGHPRKGRLLCELSESLGEIGRFEEARHAADDAGRIAAAAGDESVTILARFAGLSLRLYSDPVGVTEEIERVTHEAIPILERLEDDQALAIAWRLVGTTEWMRVHAAAAEGAFLRALEYARNAGDRAAEAVARQWAIIAIVTGPTHIDDAFRRASQIAAESGGDRTVEAFLINTRARMSALDGRFDEARRLYRSAVATLEDLGQRVTVAATTDLLAFIEDCADDPVRKEAALRTGYEGLSELGERSYLSTLAAELADVLADLGRYDEAESFVRVAIDAGDPLDLATQIYWRAAQARIEASRGNASAAERLAGEAVALSDESDYPDAIGFVRVSVGRTYLLLGRDRDAARSFIEAADVYDGKGYGMLADRARTYSRAAEGSGS